MIAIITYISVLERTKEIGIPTCNGASKKDIRHIFTAETAIEGFISGVLGIAITLLATLPINAVVAKMTNVENVAQLHGSLQHILIGISIVLTMLAGLIPSHRREEDSRIAPQRITITLQRWIKASQLYPTFYYC